MLSQSLIVFKSILIFLEVTILKNYIKDKKVKKNYSIEQAGSKFLDLIDRLVERSIVKKKKVSASFCTVLSEVVSLF